MLWSQPAIRTPLAAGVGLLTLLLIPGLAAAAPEGDIPTLQLTLAGGATEPAQVSLALEILFLLTVLSLAPAIMMTVTSFTRIIIVFHFLRQAMGIQQLPPTQILASLAIFMTVIIMYPVGRQINDEALQPYLAEEIGFDVALDRAQVPLRNFMFRHTREKDISVFYSIANMEQPRNKDEVPTMMLAAAYVISEMKTGFSIGFLIYIPFLIVDMVVSSILLAMGMMMLPPMMVSMPFKLLLFVMVDGWNLLIGSLVNSFLT
ncbi:MAG: flagellar type III secretion system pore protein FliP [Desulfovibrionaceae bacterium]|nr:flagellar type III secretion system pore protein FliP [Desulfovibrionaceae bacterium]